MLPTQRALWRLKCQLGQPGVLNLSFGVLLDGPLDTDALQWAIQQVVARHQPLHTSYTGSIETPSARHLDPGLCRLSLAQATDGMELAACFSATAQVPFTDTLPLQSQCLVLEPDRHLLLVTFDHLAVDGWSIEIFCREVEKFYAARLRHAQSELPSLPEDLFANAVRAWHQWRDSPLAEVEMTRHRSYFCGIGKNAIEPFSSTRPARRFMRRRVLALQPADFKRWLDTGTAAGLTPFPLLAAAVSAAICRCFDLEEVALAGLTANRHGTAAQRLMGAHYSAVILRARCPQDTSLTKLASQLSEDLLTAMSQRLEFDAVTQVLGECCKADRPLAPRCIVVMDRHPMHRFALEDITAMPLSSLTSEGARLNEDVSLPVAPAGDLVVFLRVHGDSAGISVFWHSDAIPSIDSFVEHLSGALGAQGATFCVHADSGASENERATLALDGQRWLRVHPAVDALSPLPGAAALIA